MQWRILSIMLLSWCLPAGIARAQEADPAGGEVEAPTDEAPARQTITVEFDSQADQVLKREGEPLRKEIDKVQIPTPPAIAAAVKSWTGISERGKRVLVRFIHNTQHSKYVAMSYGDGYSMIGSIGVKGKNLFENETHVRYEETLTASDEKSFCILGLYEFENAISERRCTVICRIEGEKMVSGNPHDPVVHAKGTATWIGPIVDASGSAFREDIIVQSNSRLNSNNLDTILDNRDKYTDADVVQLLGPADSIRVGGDLRPGRTEMMWEEVSRIELTFRDGKLEAMSGKFSPHHRSKWVNYPAFKKLKTGMRLYDVHQNCCRGVMENKTVNPDTRTTTRTYEIYHRFRVFLKDGKVRSAGTITYGVDR